MCLDPVLAVIDVFLGVDPVLAAFYVFLMCLMCLNPVLAVFCVSNVSCV